MARRRGREGIDETADAGGQTSSRHAARKGESMPPGMPSHGRQPQYDNWTLDELRALAKDLRVRDADSRTREELIEALSTHR